MYSTGDTVIAAVDTVTWCTGVVVSSTIQHGQRIFRIRVTDPCDAPGISVGDIVEVPPWRVEPNQPQLILPTEGNRALRGHRFYPTVTELDDIPDIGDTSHLNPADVTVHLHYFAPFGDWWVTEIARDGSHLGTAYGYIHFPAHDAPESGRMWLPELEQLRVTLHDIPVIVERDLAFRPTTVRDIPRITDQQP